MAFRKALLVPTLIVALAYLLYEPVPSYVHDRYSIALQIGADKICRYIASAAALSGLWDAPQVGICRAVGAAASLAQAAFLPPSPPVNSSRLSIVPGRFGPSPAIAFLPAGARPGGPLLVWIHGGGWVRGSPEASAVFAARFATETNVTVVAIGYRLAPEHQFPAAFDDCLAAVRAILSHGAADLGANPHRVMLGGDGSGGQLAAAVTQRLAQHGEPVAPRMQLLVYPVTQLANFRTQSYRESFRSPLLSGAQAAEGASLYLTGSAVSWRTMLANGHAAKSVRTTYAKHLGESVDSPGPTDTALATRLEKLLVDPRVSPLLAPTVDALRMPPAYIIACQHDPLRSDAHLYFQRLERAGVRVYYKYYPCYHGCLTGDADAKRVVEELVMFFNSNALL